MALEDYYNNNPVAVVDQNVWDDRIPQVVMRFQTGPIVYTPLIQWVDRSQQVGASTSIYTELLDGDVDNDEIGITDKYLADPLGVDSRNRRLATARYGDKVQLDKSSNVFQMWQQSGGRDWRPLLSGVLGSNIIRKFEVLSRNAYLLGPQDYWTYAGDATDFGDLDNDHKFSLDIVNAWNLRVGQTGTPVIPGDLANAKVAILPPGAIFDFMSSLAGASQSEASMWRDVNLYSGKQIRYEIGSYKNVRFVEVPNDNYGQNNAVLYNAGQIQAQYGVKNQIAMGDGAPDPETTSVDGTWFVGQKAVTHYITLEDGADMSDFSKNDWVSIGIVQTDDFGVTGGNDFRSGKTVVRRIVSIDAGNKRLAFDRPIMRNYKTLTALSPVSTGADDFYAIVTKAVHVGFVLVLGAPGGIVGNVNKPLEFYYPKPVDDFESVWRYVWDFIGGYNIWDPSLFECHFVAVSIAKPGGIISPIAAGS